MCSMDNGPWWVMLTTWVVVNLAQAVGFASRRNHGMVVNNSLGVVIAVLAAPASAALVGYARAGSPWWLGPAVFDRFDALATVVALDVGRAAVDVVERADIAMSGVR